MTEEDEAFKVKNALPVPCACLYFIVYLLVPDVIVIWTTNDYCIENTKSR